MGIYLNPGNDLFYSTVTYSEIYVDKTMLISFTNKCLEKTRRSASAVPEDSESRWQRIC